MKISKLFHWLYAFVMFLPVFALGGTLLISTFNMSAKQESEIIYKYETNEVNSNDDLVLGNIYRFYTDDYEHFSTYNEDYYLQFTCILDTNFDYQFNSIDENFYVDIKHDFNSIIGDFTSGLISFYTGNDSYTTWAIEQQGLEIEAIVILTGDSVISSDFYSSFSKVDSAYIPIERVETHNLNTREVFYDTLDDIKESPYFNWAYNSFLAQPLVYIVTLFSIPANHIVVELLSYWLAISIIWLVFDLIMYVPLLVHRWLDKGVLE